MDAQKHVSAGSVQFTATMKPGRGAARTASQVGEHPVLDGDRPQVARPDAEERVPWRLVVVFGNLEASRRARG